jgi:hypothetical protein
MEGIRIQDVSVEIGQEGLDALLRREGAQLKITSLDLQVSPEALNTLLAGLAPAGATPPTAAVSDGRLRVDAVQDGKRLALDLQVGGFRLELSSGGVRLVSQPNVAEPHL